MMVLLFSLVSGIGQQSCLGLYFATAVPVWKAPLNQMDNLKPQSWKQEKALATANKTFGEYKNTNKNN
jgi:hypothetical protein